jgi:CheY-like chemotaxis protein
MFEMANKRALIVDDSKTAQYRLKKLLRKYQLDTVAVDSGEAALSYLASNVPDVVFMDHMMPGMDGFRALQIIKSHPATATIPVIMYTSKSGDLYTSQARALGALGVVSKDTITAADLRKVLKAIHICDDEEPQQASEPAEPASKLPATAPSTPSNRSDDTLSVELRLRELEHTIDDNRRIITSRLVREMQGVRHDVRKFLGEVVELKRGGEREEPSTHTPPTRSPSGGRFRSAFAGILLLGVVGALLYWLPDIDRQLEQINQSQAALNQRIDELPSPSSAPPMPVERSAPDNSMALLPDLSWAINQNSVQEFHSDLISPELIGRVDELLWRLASRGFHGTVQVSVSGGDFCVVTNVSGQPQLPETSAQLEDCMLMSELYGTEITLEMAERMESRLAESAVLNNHRVRVEVVPLLETFESYPALHFGTPARQWNEAARRNNRVLINLHPGDTAQTAQRP